MASTVLVIEDNQINVKLFTMLLTKKGYAVEVAANGAEAWRRLSGEPGMDLVITDLNMPDTDGFELLRRVRELPEDRRPPTIVLTAVGQVLDHARAIELGAVRVMTKPFSSIEILDAVRQRLPAPGMR